MEAQEIFDKVVRHLLTQKCKSEVFEGETKLCLYRGPNGTKCAVGGLIPDDMWEAYIGERHNSDSASFLPEIVSVYIGAEKNMDLLANLQRIHDGMLVEVWRSELLQVAERYHLNSAVFNEFPET